jgi:polar amino acid transport system ATP-binding protein
MKRPAGHRTGEAAGNGAAGTTEYAVELRGIRKSYTGTEVLSGVDLAVRPGEVTAVLGPSGSGKSALLRIVNHPVSSTAHA